MGVPRKIHTSRERIAINGRMITKPSNVTKRSSKRFKKDMLPILPKVCGIF
jgi:hypothetical protein